MNRIKKLRDIHFRKKIYTNIILMIITVLLFIPLWYTLINAFKIDKYIFLNPMIITAKSFTLSNIVRAFSLMNYPRLFLNSALILVISCAMLILFGSMAGFGIVMARNKRFENLYAFFIVMITLPFQLAMVPLISMLKHMNLLNTYIGIGLVYTGYFISFVIFLYTGFIRTIPGEIEEAARVDGCGLLRIYFSIYLPLLKTITGVVLVLRGVAIWNDLLIPLITITKSTMATLPLKLVSFVGSHYTSWELVFGGTLIVSTPILIIFIAMQRYFVTGIMQGAIKQ